MTASTSPVRNRFLDEVERLRTSRIQSFLSNDLAQVFGQSLRGLSEQVQVAYLDRYLFELIQNAHDAMPDTRTDGRVRVTLSEPGPDSTHGVLSVANTGSGLSAEQFTALTALAQSSKPPGQGIGNKGIGFRSVFQVCASPEIYSTDPAEPQRPGYTFRLATRADVLGMAELPEDRERLLHLPPDFVPIGCGIPEDVEGAWRDGFATVVRLPLKSGRALEASRRALRKLADRDVPVHLFLARLAAIDVEAPDMHVSLTREFQPLWSHVESSGALVRLNRVDEFLLVSRTVPEQTIRDAIEAAFNEGALTESWRKWKGDARVEAAVPLGWDFERAQTYTFLPLGDQSPAPFHGHLNGPFYTDVDRKGLNLDHPLNTAVHGWAASLCLSAAERLRGDDLGYGPGPALDLVVWRLEPEQQGQALALAAAGVGVELADAPLVPTGVYESQWSPARLAREWPAGDWNVLTPGAAEAAGARDLVRSQLGDARVARLRAFSDALGVGTHLSPADLSRAVEAIAARMYRRGATIQQWDGFYLDLGEMFRSSPSALVGRRVLLTKDSGLVAAGDAGAGGPERPAVFFQPIRGGAEEDAEAVEGDSGVIIPETLRSSAVFLHEDLTWHEDRTRLPSRDFLARSKLAMEYRAAAITAVIRAAMQGSPAEDLSRDAFHLAFSLYRARPYSDARRVFGDLRLRVPTVGGMRRARDALFSASWPGTAGEDLELLSGTPSEVSPELHALGDRLLVPPDQIEVQGGGQLIEFMRLIGVIDALPLRFVRVAKTEGRLITRDHLPGRLEASDVVRDLWARVLPGSDEVIRPYTPMELAGPGMPIARGQSDHAALGDKLKHAYARLLIRGLEKWGDWALTVDWVHHLDRYRARTVATPLKGFIEGAEWLPSRAAGSDGLQFKRPSEVWHFRSDRSDRPPTRLASLVDVPARRQLEQQPIAMSRLVACGLRSWNDGSATIQVLQFLGEQLRSGVIPAEAERTFEREVRNAWHWMSCPDSPTLPEKGVWPLRAGRGHDALDSATLRRNPVLLTDSTTPRALRGLVRDYQLPVIEIDPGTAEEALPRFGDRATIAQRLDWSVSIDAEPVRLHRSQRLSEVYPWLRKCVTTVAFHPGAARPPGEEVRRRIPARIDTTFVARGEVTVRLLGQDRPLPDGFTDVLPWADEEAPALVLTTTAPTLGEWELLALLPSALCEVLGAPQLSDRLALVLMRLRERHVAPNGELSDEQLAEAAEIEPADVSKALAEARASLSEVWRRAVPLLVHYAGADTDAFEEPATEHAFEELVARQEDFLPGTAAEFIYMVHEAPTLDEARLQLGISLPEINQSLATLGRPPIDRTPQHRDLLRTRLSLRRTELLERLRSSWADELARYEPVRAWRQLRQLMVEPDPTWGTLLDEAPLDLIDAHIDSEIARQTGRPLAHQMVGLAAMTEVEAANERFLRVRMRDLQTVVLAWCMRRGRPVPQLWDEDDLRPGGAIQALSDIGALSLDELDDEALISWVSALSAWPPGMPKTAALGALGLTASDLAAAQGVEADQRRAQQRAQRLVTIGGRAIDAEEEGSLLEAVDSILDNLGGSLGARRFTESVAPEWRQRSEGSVQAVVASRLPRLSASQAGAIGLAGERVAERWLQMHYSYDPSCWVSGNSMLFHRGNRGDDSLGYDFAAAEKAGGRPFYFEVKASLGAIEEVELTAGEVSAAQRYGDRWRILLVPFAGSAPRVLMLRNPFVPRHRNQFQILGTGLRVRFQLPAREAG